YDISLIIESCDILHPLINTIAPKGYIELICKCWHSDLNKRPTAIIICNVIKQIILNEENNLTIIIEYLNARSIITNKFTSGSKITYTKSDLPKYT
ncbi:17188_t:CDS:2, partial [Funneliformis geosporum]